MLPRVGTGVGLRADGRAGAEEDTGEMAQHREVHKRAGPCGMDRGRGQTEKVSSTLFHKAPWSGNAIEKCPAHWTIPPAELSGWLQCSTSLS